VHTVVGGVQHDGVVGNLKVIQLFQKYTNLIIVLNHADI